MRRREVSFNTSNEARQLAAKIAERAVALAKEYEIPDVLKLDVEMDIVATHANGCPLRLEDLLAADNENFGHDVFGIRRHLNRKTGDLGGHFRPRFAARTEAI